ncbi:MAG: redox-regulated ATPase YchF [Candidatus Aenigmarchaeota archaeon]|nr:redox-regulated ATPase YchF [Candidatus Aenigmarchaeota archaeon]
MLIGLVGKSNCGKSTMFAALTMIDVEISNRIFTTIEPNKGVTYVRSKCPCGGGKCNAQNSRCVDGVRFVPVKLVDIAGLVPGAHEGKGLGNKFLSDIMEANALIHVVDISGSTDESGNPIAAGTRDPKDDIAFLEEEIDYWILGILKRNLTTLSRRMEATKEKFPEVVHKQVAGLGIKLSEVERAMNETEITPQSDDYDLLKFVRAVREKSKPIILAANKADIESARENIARLSDLGYQLFPCSAEYELALRRAAEKGIIEYNPGDKDFRLLKNIDAPHQKALEHIRGFLSQRGSTGVQKIIDHIVFEVLKMIVVYPVENEHKMSDAKGNVLPHAFLMRRGSTALDLAFKVHEDIGKKFVAAIDARSGKQLSASYELKDGDVISIRSGR